MLLSLLILFVCFVLLALVCDEFFVPALEKIATKWKLSSEVAGATLMAVGSSAPELFTSLFAVLNPSVAPSLGAGTIVGSAIFNVLVIVGASVLIRGAVTKLQRQPVVRDLIFYSVAIVFLLWSFWDGQVFAWEMLMFLILYVVYIVCTKYWSAWLGYGQEKEEFADEENQDNHGEKGDDSLFVVSWIVKIMSLIMPKGIWGAFGVSIVTIGLLTHVMVEAGVHFAHSVGMSEALIGLTILAAGTSVPDLISSLIVAKKGHADMAVSNALGSNIFDILFGLGVPYLIYFWFVSSDTFLVVDNENLTASIMLLLATVVTMLFLLIVRKWKLGRWSGLFLIGLYVAYIVYTVIQM